MGFDTIEINLVCFISSQKYRRRDGPLGQKGQLPPLSGNELKFQEQKSGIAWFRNELFK